MIRPSELSDPNDLTDPYDLTDRGALARIDTAIREAIVAVNLNAPRDAVADALMRALDELGRALNQDRATAARNFAIRAR
jgi:hypothetical protein